MQIDQVQKKMEEEKAKVAVKAANINQTWDAKKSLSEASTSGMKTEGYEQPSGPLEQSQRAAKKDSTPDQLVRHNGIILPF